MRTCILQAVVIILGVWLIESPLTETHFFRTLPETWQSVVVSTCFPIAAMATGLLLDGWTRKESIGLATGYYEYGWFAKITARVAGEELKELPPK